MTLINDIICVILWVSFQTNLQYPTYIGDPDVITLSLKLIFFHKY